MISKGVNWGTSGSVPANAVFVYNDADANEAVSAARRANNSIPPLCLVGGDLARTLGVRNNEAQLRAGEGTYVRVDLGAALIDGRLYWFVAHLVARRSWWKGQIVVAANAAFLGAYNVAPKAHPSDGLLDVVTADPRLSDRLKARSRLRSGTHMPHPDIKLRRCAATQFELEQPTPISIDGRVHGKAKVLSLRVEPEALDIWI